MELAKIFACKETRSADGKEIFFILGSPYLNHPHFRFIFPSDINILENILARIPLAGRSLSKPLFETECHTGLGAGSSLLMVITLAGPQSLLSYIPSGEFYDDQVKKHAMGRACSLWLEWRHAYRFLL
jgi:hypothetical protein